MYFFFLAGQVWRRRIAGTKAICRQRSGDENTTTGWVQSRKHCCSGVVAEGRRKSRCTQEAPRPSAGKERPRRSRRSLFCSPASGHKTGSLGTAGRPEEPRKRSQGMQRRRTRRERRHSRGWRRDGGKMDGTRIGEGEGEEDGGRLERKKGRPDLVGQGECEWLRKDEAACGGGRRDDEGNRSSRDGPRSGLVLLAVFDAPYLALSSELGPPVWSLLVRPSASSITASGRLLLVFSPARRPAPAPAHRLSVPGVPG